MATIASSRSLIQTKTCQQTEVSRLLICVTGSSAFAKDLAYVGSDFLRWENMATTRGALTTMRRCSDCQGIRISWGRGLEHFLSTTETVS